MSHGFIVTGESAVFLACSWSTFDGGSSNLQVSSFNMMHLKGEYIN